MSTNSQNINISPQNVQGYCDMKCSYNFNYQESGSTATNNGVMISLTYDTSNTPPVLYNNQKYNVTGMYISCPSIHYFNNTQAAGELIINHSPVSSGPNLSIGIPFIASSEYSVASSTITEIIETVSASAPVDGESVTLNIADFTLQTIIPNKPYFTYTSTSDGTEWIVFNILNAIPLSTNTLTTLQQIIQPYYITTPGDTLFYNSTGPNSADVGDGIYISCQPTGSSDEETTVTYNKNTTNYNLFDNPTALIIFQVVIGCIVFILIFLLLNYAYGYFTGDEKLPSITKQMNNLGTNNKG